MNTEFVCSLGCCPGMESRCCYQTNVPTPMTANITVTVSDEVTVPSGQVDTGGLGSTTYQAKVRVPPGADVDHVLVAAKNAWNAKVEQEMKTCEAQVNGHSLFSVRKIFGWADFGQLSYHSTPVTAGQLLGKSLDAYTL